MSATSAYGRSDSNGGLCLTMDDWEELIEIFDIRQAMIHHDLKKISKGSKGKKAKYDNGD